MEVRICKTCKDLGKSAAEYVANILKAKIEKNGSARIVLSTGASQFDTIEALVAIPDIKWECVEMFHLDEYVDLPVTHVASFRKYLQERFVDKVGTLKAVHFVDGTREGIAALTEEIRRAPIDIGLIGIGENAHIAFNDPPADFEDQNAYKVVVLAERCRQQQLGEGWFATLADVPEKAISMTVSQILRCRHIISAVPYAVKAQAIHDTLTSEITNMVPATIMKNHPSVQIFVDADSASMLPDSVEMVK